MRVAEPHAGHGDMTQKVHTLA